MGSPPTATLNGVVPNSFQNNWQNSPVRDVERNAPSVEISSHPNFATVPMTAYRDVENRLK